VGRGPAVVGAATAVWVAGSSAQAATHEVRKGDTLSSIAKRYRTTVDRLAKANGITDANLIVAGQKLRLPASARVTSVHVVARGETLASIANRYGATVQQLIAANHIANPNLIVAGSHLKVPGSSGSGASDSTTAGSIASSSSGWSTHVVARGETLASIANRYGATVQQLAGANHIANPNLIVTGEHLRVPGGGSSSSTSAPTTTASVGSTLRSQAAGVGVNTTLVEAVAWQESGWNQKAVSVTGARGVMQLTRGTTDYVNQVLGGGHLSRGQMTDNVRLGVLYLDHLLGMFPERKALAAYFSGPGNIHRHLDRAQKHYVDSIEAIQARL
jgi:LysM repeat protein